MFDPLEWDKGLHAAKFHRVVELATWLQGRPDGSTFTAIRSVQLASWSHFKDQVDNAFNMEFKFARELLQPLGIRVEFVNGTYRKQRPIRLNSRERQALLMALSVADPGDPRGTDGVPFGLGLDRREAEALLQFSDELDVVIDALAQRSAVEISHRGRRRTLDPYGLGFATAVGTWWAEITSATGCASSARVAPIPPGFPGARPPVDRRFGSSAGEASPPEQRVSSPRPAHAGARRDPCNHLRHGARPRGAHVRCSRHCLHRRPRCLHSLQQIDWQRMTRCG
jgi:hypothetical protein